MKKIILLTIVGLLAASICFAQNQLPENGGFHQEGVASWYGTEFQGRPTASGELFDPNQFTAAHRDLPYGTILNVTNIINGKQVQVRINDRGPMNPGRIIDVSRAAAERLDMMATGTAQVSIEIASRGSTQPANPITFQSGQPNNQVNNQPALSGNGANYGNTPNPNPFQLPNNPPPNIAESQPTPYSQPTTMRQPTQQTSATRAPVATTPYSTQPSSTVATPANTAAATGRLPAPTQPNIAVTPTTRPAPPTAVPAPGTIGATAAANRPPPALSTSAAAASNRPPAVSTPAATAAATGRLPAPAQPNVVPGTPRPVVTTNRVVPQSSAPSIPSSQPVNVTNSAARNSTTPAYSAIQPNVAPASPSPPMPTANPNALMPNNSVARNNVTPQPAPSRTPANNSAPNYSSVNSYPRVPSIPDAPPAVARPIVTYDTAEIKGGPIHQGKTYRLQIGSYKVPKNAIEAIDRLNSVGLSAQYEQFGEMYRVVITNVISDAIPQVAQRIGNAGFREAVAREER